MTNISLHLIDATKYLESISKIVKETEKSRKIIYVSSAKPYGALLESFHKNKIHTENMYIIDCISRESSKDIPKQVTLIGSPEGLTAISIAINNIIKTIGSKKCAVIIDSLSTLSIYNDSKVMIQFINFFLDKIRTLGDDAVLFALKSDKEKELVQQAAMAADKVIA